MTWDDFPGFLIREILKNRDSVGRISVEKSLGNAGEELEGDNLK